MPNYFIFPVTLPESRFIPNCNFIPQIMKRHLLLFSCMLCNLIAFSQISLKPKSVTKGDTYALIVGISDYKDEKIRDLRFAHRDAEIFAQFLESTAGGNVPPENIRLLTNEDATIANIYLAKEEFEKKVKSKDRFYFYFSGHGDVESDLYRLGFLIAHDTPNKNYLNNAVRIEDINNMANTMSVLKDVEVILITDACHSGKLAGSDNRGKMLVGEQLSKVEKKEIRIASCESDQESQEDEAWGGGRGAFSYHLVNGLQGLADGGEKDGIITLMELESYLETKVMNDVMKVKLEDQIPVVEGKKITKMAMVDMTTLEMIEAAPVNEFATNLGQGSKSMSSNPSMFDFVKSTDFKNGFNLREWSVQEDLVDYACREFNIDRKDLDRKKSLNEFKNVLAAKLHDEIQLAVNAYLDGDREHLEMRQYYSDDSDFEDYIYMIRIALRLVDKESSLAHILTVKKHYFEGVNARLQMLTSSNIDSLVQIAHTHQNQALDLEPQAAYIQNEMGIIQRLIKGENAEQHFKKAIELAPTWGLPYSNLSGHFRREGQHEKGEEHGRKAIELAPHLYNGYMQIGRIMFDQGNLLFAEEHFYKARKINEKHYSPPERLAEVYSKLTRYAEAEALFHEAEEKKLGLELLNPILADEDADGIIDMFDSEPESDSKRCEIDTSLIGPKDVMAHFLLGFYDYLDKRYNDAAAHFKSALKNNPNDPVIYKYLADCHFKSQNWMEAEFYYNEGLKNYLPSEEFEKYAKTLLEKEEYNDCEMFTRYTKSHYKEEEIHYLLASVYEEMSSFEKAEDIYESRILLNEPVAYFHLIDVLEKQKRYTEAENVIISLAEIDMLVSKASLLNFYNRRVQADENPNTYRYQAGLLCYDIENFGKLFLNVHEEEPSPTGLSAFYHTPITTPGTEEKIYPNFGVSDPDKKAFDYFNSIIDLESYDSTFVADVYFRKGILLQKLNESEESKLAFEKANNFNPNNASFASNYIASAEWFYDFENIYHVLSSLNENDQMDLPHLRKFADYNMRKGDFDQCTTNLNKLTNTTIIEDQSALITRVLNAYRAGNNDVAIEGFRKLIDKNIIPEYEIKYTMARIFAEMDNQEATLASLREAIDGGFNYSYVLHKDEAFYKYEDNEEFKLLKSRMILPQI